MFVTGRLPIVTGIGVIPVIALASIRLNPWLVTTCWMLLVIILVAADVAAAPSARVLHVERDLPARVLLGQPVSAHLRLTNSGSRTITGWVRDAWQPTAGSPTTRAQLRIPSSKTWHLELPLLPRRRGQLTSEFVMVRSLGPLRLAGRQSRIDAPGALKVLPPFTSRKHLPSRVARLRELDGSTRVNLRGQGTEFDSLREYVRGDDIRSIDWRATARSQSTMIRTWQPERDRHVVIMIDTGRTAATRVGDSVRLDACIESALLLAALASHAGDHVHLVMFDRAPRARVTRVDGPALLPTLVDAISPVQAQLIDTDWDAARAEIDAMTSRPSLVVLLTAQDATDSARRFLAGLPLLTRRTRVIVGSVTDNPVVAPANADATDVYREAAAERTSAEATLVASAMMRAGTVPITGTPDELPPRVADRYIELKAAGLL